MRLLCSCVAGRKAPMKNGVHRKGIVAGHKCQRWPIAVQPLVRVSKVLAV
jgi:hypothetical protein